MAGTCGLQVLVPVFLTALALSEAQAFRVNKSITTPDKSLLYASNGAHNVLNHRYMPKVRDNVPLYHELRSTSTGVKGKKITTTLETPESNRMSKSERTTAPQSRLSSLNKEDYLGPLEKVKVQPKYRGFSSDRAGQPHYQETSHKGEGRLNYRGASVKGEDLPHYRGTSEYGVDLPDYSGAAGKENVQPHYRKASEYGMGFPNYSRASVLVQHRGPLATAQSSYKPYGTKTKPSSLEPFKPALRALKPVSSSNQSQNLPGGTGRYVQSQILNVDTGYNSWRQVPRMDSDYYQKPRQLDIDFGHYVQSSRLDDKHYPKFRKTMPKVVSTPLTPIIYVPTSSGSSQQKAQTRRQFREDGPSDKGEGYQRPGWDTKDHPRFRRDGRVTGYFEEPRQLDEHSGHYPKFHQTMLKDVSSPITPIIYYPGSSGSPQKQSSQQKTPRKRQFLRVGPSDKNEGYLRPGWETGYFKEPRQLDDHSGHYPKFHKTMLKDVSSPITPTIYYPGPSSSSKKKSSQHKTQSKKQFLRGGPLDKGERYQRYQPLFPRDGRVTGYFKEPRQLDGHSGHYPKFHQTMLKDVSSPITPTIYYPGSSSSSKKKSSQHKTQSKKQFLRIGPSDKNEGYLLPGWETGYLKEPRQLDDHSGHNSKFLQRMSKVVATPLTAIIYVPASSGSSQKQSSQ